MDSGKLKPRFTTLSIVAVLALAAYVVATAAFVYDAPDSRHQEASGILLQGRWSETLAQADKDGTPLSIGDIVAGVGYDPKEVWVPLTVTVVRSSLLALWLVFFGCLSSSTAVLIRFLEREEVPGIDNHIGSLPGLSRGVRTTMEGAGIETIGDVVKRREEVLLAINGIGGKSLEEIRNALKKVRLTISY